MTIAETLENTRVTSVDLSRYIPVAPETTVAETVKAMSEADFSCACVVKDGSLQGIFTQRDVVMRVIGRPNTWNHAISHEMSRAVRTMRSSGSVADGLATMVDWWVRSVPVLSENDTLVGNLSFYAVMSLMAENLASRIQVRSTEPSIEFELNFVDFTGLNTYPPVTVGLDEPVSDIVHHMRARGIGSVLVRNQRGHLAGIVTEFDLQTKVGCEHPDPSVLKAEDVMSQAIALSPRSSVADAIREIAEQGHSNVPLIAESGRPAGIASFRDVAAYVETSLEAIA